QREVVRSVDVDRIASDRDLGDELVRWKIEHADRVREAVGDERERALRSRELRALVRIRGRTGVRVVLDRLVRCAARRDEHGEEERALHSMVNETGGATNGPELGTMLLLS